MQNLTTQAESGWTKVIAFLCPHGAEWILNRIPRHEKHRLGLKHEGQPWGEAWFWPGQLASVFNPIHLHSSQRCFGPRTRMQKFTTQAESGWTKVRGFLCPHGSEGILIRIPRHEKHWLGLKHEGQPWRKAWNWPGQLASVFTLIHLHSSQRCIGPRTWMQNITT